MVQGADGCTMVTGASDSIGPMTPQPLRFMCSGAVLPLQCFTLGVPTARHPRSSRLVEEFALQCRGALLADRCPITLLTAPTGKDYNLYVCIVI